MSAPRPRRFVPWTVPALLAAVFGVSGRAFAANPSMSECLSANENAIKLRADHSLRQARDQTLVCSALSCPGAVRAVCQRRITDLNAAIPTLVFAAQDATGNDLTAVRVAVDGQPLVERLEGTAIAVDPGEHTFSFEVTGQPKVDKKLVVYEGVKGRREQITIGIVATDGEAVHIAVPVLPGARTEAASNPPSPPLAPPPPKEHPEARPRHPARTAGFVVGGMGIAAAGAGAAFGLLTLSAKSSALRVCGEGSSRSCPPGDVSPANAQLNTARTDALLSTLGFAVGAAALGVGTFLIFWRGPSGATVGMVPSIRTDGGRLSLQGAF